ncbi:MAG: hypothetical protein IJT74_01985 [Bacteroidales bacterium]|nr:hypothetical protein [Bacteroidales bacterium]
MFYTLQDVLFGASLAVYVAASVIVSVVRWGHRCEPYAHHMDYYHPGWKTVVFCFLTNLMMLPLLFMLREYDAIMALRLILMLASPYFCAMFLFTYFGKMLGHNSWMWPLLLLSIPFAVMVLVTVALAVEPGVQFVGRDARIVGYVSGSLTLIFLYAYGAAFHMIAKARRRFSEENYSNPEDFPQEFAGQAIWLAGLHLIVSWTISFIGTKPVLTIGLILLTVVIIAFLIIDLSPHRTLDVNRLEAEHHAKISADEMARHVWENSEPEEVEVLSPARKEEILQLLRHAVEEDRAYLDNHLTLARLSRDCGVNRTYVSAVMNEYLGGFFTYINRCRLDHASRYRTEHPESSIEEVATSSGFGSRQSYYNARRQLEG